MIDENTIAFVDKKNAVQIWNIHTNSNISNELLKEKIDITYFTNFDKHFLVVDPSN